MRVRLSAPFLKTHGKIQPLATAIYKTIAFVSTTVRQNKKFKPNDFKGHVSETQYKNARDNFQNNHDIKIIFERSFYCTVETRYNEGLRDWQLNLFVMTRFCYIEVLFHIFYSHDWGKENGSLNRGLRCIELPLY